MNIHRYPLLASCIIIASVATAGLAQQAPQRQDPLPSPSTPGRSICGTLHFAGGEPEALANTARSDPERYRRIVDRGASPSFSTLLRTADDEMLWTFKIRNRISGQYDEIDGVLMFAGKWARIWVDPADTGRIPASTIAAIARALDTATPAASRDPKKGIIENVIDVFGTPPPNRFDLNDPLVQDFFLTDVKENMGNGEHVAGFFSPWDQTDNPGSNKMNLLYIDSKEGLADGLTSVLSTLAHEFQHLIHYGVNRQSETFYNEGCSEVASTICGYRDRGVGNYMSNTNVSLFSWETGSGTLPDYERALLFVRYLYEQFGESFITKLVATTSTGTARLADAMTATGHGAEWQGVMKGWGAANAIGTGFDDPRYIYTMILSGGTARPQNIYSGEFPTGGSLSLQPYGIVYNVYTFAPAGGIRAKFETSQSSVVMAILYRGGKVVEVREIANKAESVIGQTAGYDRITFAMINLMPYGQTIKWSVERVTSGVGASSERSPAPVLANLAPNPAASSAVVSFSTVWPGGVILELYDAGGELVRVIADGGEHFDVGDHRIAIDTRDLPAGLYMLRLRQGRLGIARPLMVVR